MSSGRGHKHTSSVTQNHKAVLANAYNELGKELSSTKIRVVGNYTLGKVIGEGRSCTHAVISLLNLISLARSVWKSSVRDTSLDFNPCRHQTGP
jgi:hypothetical protein